MVLTFGHYVLDMICMIINMIKIVKYMYHVISSYMCFMDLVYPSNLMCYFARSCLFKVLYSIPYGEIENQ